GVEGRIDDSRGAQSALQAMVSILVRSGIKCVAILLDEFENFTLIPKASRERYMDDIRHFIDDNPTGLCLAIATTPSSYKDLSDPPSALTRRLAGNEFQLKEFELPEIRELIVRYLKIGRRDKAVPASTTSAETYPFTEDAIRK